MPAERGRRHEALNRAVLPALAEQIRLRNLSGGIVVDVAGLSPRKRAGLAPDFAAALANDPLQPKFLGFTALGLAEIVRSRVHPPLHELLSGPLAVGLAALRAVMAEYDRDPRALPAVRAHPGLFRPCKPTRRLCPICCGGPDAGRRYDQTHPCRKRCGYWRRTMAKNPNDLSHLRAAISEATRPFCTPRCQEVDLGRWLTGVYRIPAPGRTGRGPAAIAGRGVNGVAPDAA